MLCCGPANTTVRRYAPCDGAAAIVAALVTQTPLPIPRLSSHRPYHACPQDLKLFLQDTGQPSATPILETPWANATNNASMPGGEGQMDIELITATATGVQSTFWYSSNDIYNGFLDFQMQIANVANPPLVWSCSWGTPESDMGPDGTAFEQRVSFELQKMGARGMTMVFASGDAGVTAAGRGGNCDTFQVRVSRVPWRGICEQAHRSSPPLPSPLHTAAIVPSVIPVCAVSVRHRTRACQPWVAAGPAVAPRVHVRASYVWHGHAGSTHRVQQPRRADGRAGDPGHVLL